MKRIKPAKDNHDRLAAIYGELSELRLSADMTAHRLVADMSERPARQEDLAKMVDQWREFSQALNKVAAFVQGAATILPLRSSLKKNAMEELPRRPGNRA